MVNSLFALLLQILLMKRYLLVALGLLAAFSSCVRRDTDTGLKRPKLVIGIVVDQMRWDYLYRYYDRYGNGGFKRLIDNGFNCQNTMLNYIPSFTGPGHSCIYTGSVPSINGIAANDWIDNLTGKAVYCVDDPTVHLVGGGDNVSPSMSPRNLLTTTITDELRLATNLQSRVYGIAIKDRGAILPAGHMANGAYWYDDSTGYFCSSNYYPNPSPQWLQAFNKRHLPDSLIKQNWNLLYPANTYTQSTPDANNYEKGFKGEKAPVFPHITDTLHGRDAYNILRTLPAGNTITLDMARACINGEKLGQQESTDFLCVSLSSTDYAGHRFGPNSVEVEDMYLRLDKELALFLNFLDDAVGSDNYLLFLTADHGAAHNERFLTDEDVPSGLLSANMQTDLNTYLKSNFGKDSLVSYMTNYQLYLNDSLIAKNKLDRQKIKDDIRGWFNKRPEVAYVVDLEDINKTPLPEPLRTMIINGYYRERSGSIQLIFNSGWYDGSATGTTHGTWQPYDTHIPLLWYGWHVPHGETHRVVHMTDISSTLAAMLNIQMPNGCIGEPITEIVK